MCKIFAELRDVVSANRDAADAHATNLVSDGFSHPEQNTFAEPMCKIRALYLAWLF